MPFMDHIRELRNRVVKIALALVAGMTAGFINPKQFVQKHLFDDLNADQEAQEPPARPAAANDTPLAPGGRPPFDPNAT